MMYFTPLEMDYIMKNPMTHTKFGLSPLESAFNHIAALLDVQEYCHGVTSNAMPKFLINLGKNLQPDQLRQYRQYFEEEVAGSGTTPIIASDGADAFQVSAINDDGTFLQYQQWLVSIIAHSFGIPPEKLGKGVSNDRSTKEQQDSDILEYAVKPYGDILESAINRLLVQMELGDKIKFEFVYEPTLAEVQRKTDIVKAQVALDMITIDEARAAIGYPALNTEYSKCTISEMKAKLNEEYAVQTGGTFGTAKDNYSDKPEKKAGDTSE
jgi:HK97 family phage portal protein